MAEWAINDVKFIEIDDATYKVSFLLDGHNLEATGIPRKETQEYVKRAIIQAIKEFEEKHAKTNFDTLKEAFGGKTSLVIKE